MLLALLGLVLALMIPLARIFLVYIKTLRVSVDRLPGPKLVC